MVYPLGLGQQARHEAREVLMLLLQLLLPDAVFACVFCVWVLGRVMMRSKKKKQRVEWAVVRRLGANALDQGNKLCRRYNRRKVR